MFYHPTTNYIFILLFCIRFSACFEERIIKKNSISCSSFIGKLDKNKVHAAAVVASQQYILTQPMECVQRVARYKNTSIVVYFELTSGWFCYDIAQSTKTASDSISEYE